MPFVFQDKNTLARGDRSVAVSSKNAIVSTREDLLLEDAFNNSFLHGDSNGNIGVNDLIWYWLYERSLEGGNIYFRPILTDELEYWRFDYNQILRAALSYTGDSRPYQQLWWLYGIPDSVYLNGFYPPNVNGIAAETINWATDYLNDNGDSRPGDTTWGYASKGDSSGFLFHIYGLKTTVGSSPTNFPWGDAGDSIVSGYVYTTSAEAIIAAKLYLYGDTVSPGTQVGTTMLGTGLIGRRRADADISTSLSVNYRYEIGDGDSDQPDFFGDSTGDINSFLDNIAYATNFTTKLRDVCLFGDSYSTYIAHLNSLATELSLIEDGTNTLFAIPDMASDMGDSELNLITLVEELSRYIGDSTGDTWKLSDNGDSTLWGLYNYFTGGSPPDGTEAGFDVALDLAKFLNDSVLTAVENRHTLLSDGTIIGSEGDTEGAFDKARKWRAFWIKTRIEKPKAVLLSYESLATAVTDSEQVIANRNHQLQILLGDTTWDHYQYIPTPLMLASFYDPKLDQDDGTVIQKKITSIFDGQQHATKYLIYRQDYTSGDSISISNDRWGDTYNYDAITELGEDSDFINTTYTDFGRVEYAGDSIQTGQELFLSGSNLLSYPNERKGDTVEGILIEPTTFTYIDPIEGDSEEIINPRAKYWHGLDAGGASGLIGYWPLNGNTRDYSGNGYHGVLTAGTGAYETGFIEECYHFDGGTSSIQLPSDIGTLTKFSICEWVYLDTLSPTDNYGRIFELRQSSDGDVIRIYFNHGGANDKLTFNCVEGGLNNIASTNVDAEAGRWYHIIGTYDGETVRLYLDLILQDTVASETGATWTPDQNAIGSPGNSSTVNNWDGLIDEVRIYNRVLTQTERTDVYNTRKMTQPWSDVTGFWKETTNVLNYPETIGDSIGYNGGTITMGEWNMSPYNTGDTTELTDYYFNDYRFSKITAVTTDSDVKQYLPPGTFGDTLPKSWSMILKKGIISGDTTGVFLLTVGGSWAGYWHIYWDDRTTTTLYGDASKTQVEWFTNDIVRFSGTSGALGDTGDTYLFIIEPQELGTGYIYATAVQLEESTYSTPYVNGSRLKSTYYFTRDVPVSGTLECYVRGRQPFDDSTGGNDIFFEWGNDATHRLALMWESNEHTFRVFWYNGGSSKSIVFGDTGGDTYFHQWHHIKFIWNFSDTSLDSAKIIIDSVAGDTGWNGTPDPYDGVSDVITEFSIGGRVTNPNSTHFGGEVTDLLIQDNTGDSGDTHYLNGVPYFYADPFPDGTNYVYRTRTIDSLNKVNGDTTKSLQSNLFDSTASTTWNAISGDSVLELGVEHDYKRNEYVVIDETTSSNGYYKLTRVEDTSIFISPALTSGDVTGVVYPTTSVVFIEE